MCARVRVCVCVCVFVNIDCDLFTIFHIYLCNAVMSLGLSCSYLLPNDFLHRGNKVALLLYYIVLHFIVLYDLKQSINQSINFIVYCIVLYYIVLYSIVL